MSASNPPTMTRLSIPGLGDIFVECYDEPSERFTTGSDISVDSATPTEQETLMVDFTLELDDEDDDESEYEDDDDDEHIRNCRDCAARRYLQNFDRDTPFQTYGNAFEDMTQGRRMPRCLHAVGPNTTLPSRMDDFFCPEREIPEDYCTCNRFISQMRDQDEYYNEGRAQYRRIQALGDDGPFDFADTKYLVALRQARHIAGLDTHDLDREIARRVLEDPEAHGWTGAEFQAMGFTDEVQRDAENYQLC